MLQMECTNDTLNADMVNKIILKMQHQLLISYFFLNWFINFNKIMKENNLIKIQKIHKFISEFIFNKNTMNTNPDFNIRTHTQIF